MTHNLFEQSRNALEQAQENLGVCLDVWVEAKQNALRAERGKTTAEISWRRLIAAAIAKGYTDESIAVGPKGGKNAKDEEAYIVSLLDNGNIEDPRDTSAQALMEAEIASTAAWADLEYARSGVTVQLEIFRAIHETS